jgi:L-lactate dehydrogenase complex protein LldF
MNVHSTSRNFKANAREQLANENLQAALNKARGHFVEGRSTARDNLAEFDALRDQARDIKNHTLAHLDFYLEAYEEKVRAAGGHVHWARTSADAQRIVLEICRAVGATSVNKGKSMIGEEIEINEALEAAGIRPVETDLGEYIIQLRGEKPSHIIAPAVHLTKAQVEESFRANHTDLDPDRVLEEPPTLLDEARTILRKKYFEAEVGITGANLLIAETGSSIIVTNEGNGDLSQLIPRVHIVLASLEKMVPTLEDAATILRVLARSATGQEFSSYTTVSTGPKREGDPDGPEQYHVVLLDNGRTEMLGTEFQDMLRCIRCGACMNHCPVYQSVGGHAYGWVYPGPMGSVLTPGLLGVDEAGHLPNASSFCGRCEEVCPVRIPLPKLMRHWREREFERHLSPGAARVGLGVWALFAKRPRLYRWGTNINTRLLAWLGRKRGRLSSLPMAGGWTKYRDLPAPEGRTFQARWKSGERPPTKAQSKAHRGSAA